MMRAACARGFSLLEMLVSMLVLTMFMGAAFTFGSHIREYQQRVMIQADAQQSGRLAIDRVEMLLRTAGSDPTGEAIASPDDALAERTATGLRILRDLPQDTNDDGDTWDVVDLDDDGQTDGDDENENGDGFLDDPAEDVTLAVADGQLRLVDNTTGTTLVLTNGVVANDGNRPIFSYVTDAEGDLVAVAVELTVATATIDPVTGETLRVTYTSTVYPRILRPRVLDAVGS